METTTTTTATKTEVLVQVTINGETREVAFEKQPENDRFQSVSYSVAAVRVGRGAKLYGSWMTAVPRRFNRHTDLGTFEYDGKEYVVTNQGYALNRMNYIVAWTSNVTEARKSQRNDGTYIA